MEPVRASSPLDPGEGAAAVAAEEEPARGKLGGRKKDKDGREGPRRRERKERKAPPSLLVPPADHLVSSRVGVRGRGKGRG